MIFIASNTHRHDATNEVMVKNLANGVSLDELSTVLFDMDGTLVDHFETIFRCYEFAAQALGKSPPTYDEVKRAVGGSMPVTIKAFFDDESLEEAKAHWIKRFDEIHLEGVRVLDGAMELIEKLENRGLHLAVFTNKSGKHTRNIIRSLGLYDTFSLILGAEDTEFRKPQPELSTYALSQLGVKPSEALLIGDSPFDIESAKCVGMRCFCVATGSYSKEELETANADAVFDGLPELMDSIFA